jgi:DNA-binding response OmpR family regulator
MTSRLLLIAPDNPRTRRLRSALETAGYSVHQDRVRPADIVVIAGDGYPIARYRETPGMEHAPLLVWLEEAGDVAATLRDGADDCVAGSAGLTEVLARIEALLRRSGHERRSQVISFGGMRVDLRRGSADLGKGAIPLTPKELHLLSYLAARAGSVIAREELLREVWGYSIAETRTVDTHMAALRRKLEANPRRPEHLFTVRGRGYQFRM